MKVTQQVLCVLALFSTGFAQYDPLRDVLLLSFTQSNPTTPDVLVYQNGQSLSNSGFSLDKPTYILVHGYVGNANDDFNFFVRNAIVPSADVNVITVDWEIGATYDEDFDVVLNRTDLTAAYIVDFITWLETEYTYNIDNVHLIGFSLGGYMVGQIGRRLGGRLPYIMALDPANFENSITRTDAVYVEVMHTSIIATTSHVGHNDFYPNRGLVMVGCDTIDIECSHLRAPRYFAETVTRGDLIGTRCASYTEILTGNCSLEGTLAMGGLHPKEPQGMFFLRTNAEPPYARE